MDTPPSIWNQCIEFAARSDVGLRRANNQDSSVVILADSQADFQRRGHFFMVADGMGAHAAGELASKMATDAVALGYRKRLGQKPSEALVSALRDANQHIHNRGQASPDFRGMGTTATALVLLPAGAIVAHVGDSRAYRLRGTQLEQLTFDHSLVWEIRAANPSPDAELPNHISKNIITRSLGPSETVQIDLEGPSPIHAGDVFMLCSDGLSGQVKDDEIGLILGCLPPAESAQTLVDLAILRGGPDNVTVVVVRVLSPQVARSSDSDSSNSSASDVRPIHPLLWALVGGAFLAAIVLFIQGFHLAALGGAIVGAAAILVGVAMRSSVEPPSDEGCFGRGPYASCGCSANEELLKSLADTIRLWCETAVKDNWPIDTAALDGWMVQAESALQAGNFSEAVRGYLRTVGPLATQLSQIRRASSDSKAGG
jgi:PPM family protein phosphatase